MSKYTILYTCHEVILDENDDYVKEYEENLPHSKQIVETFCKEWNEDADKFLLKLANEDCENKLASCKMRQYRAHDNTTTLAVDFVAKPKVWFTQRLKEKIMDFFDAQMCDGWGEGMFSYSNVMTAPDGTKFMVE